MTVAWNAATEKAIQNWVVIGSGLAADKVIWSQQDGPRPASPYIALRPASLAATGIDWVDVVDSEAPTPGNEIEYHVRGPRIVELWMQCHGVVATGDQSPVAILESVRTSHRLPSVRKPLKDAKIGVADSTPVSYLGSTINNANFEPRAVMSVTLHLASDVSEPGTVIESAEITGDVFDTVQSIRALLLIAPNHVWAATTDDKVGSVNLCEDGNPKQYVETDWLVPTNMFARRVFKLDSVLESWITGRDVGSLGEDHTEIVCVVFRIPSKPASNKTLLTSRVSGGTGWEVLIMSDGFIQFRGFGTSFPSFVLSIDHADNAGHCLIIRNDISVQPNKLEITTELGSEFTSQNSSYPNDDSLRLGGNIFAAVECEVPLLFTARGDQVNELVFNTSTSTTALNNAMTL